MADSVAEGTRHSEQLSAKAQGLIAEPSGVPQVSAANPANTRGSVKSSPNDSNEGLASADGYESNDATANRPAAEDHASTAFLVEDKKGKEDRAEEDASEEAFRAQTAAFARKDITHDLAVRRLVEDLTGNESDAATETNGHGEEGSKARGRGEEQEAPVAGAGAMLEASEGRPIEASVVSPHQDVAETDVETAAAEARVDGVELEHRGGEDWAVSENAAMEGAVEVGSIQPSAVSSGEDLIEKESEAATEAKVREVGKGPKTRGVKAAGDSAMESAADTSVKKVSAGSSNAKKKTSLIKSSSKDGKPKENKRHTPPQDAKTKRSPSVSVNLEHTPSSDSKRRVHPIKEKEKAKEKTSPGSPSRGCPSSPRKLPGSSSSKTPVRSPLKPLSVSPPSGKTGNSISPPSKPTSRPMETPNKPSPKSTASVTSLENKGTLTDNVHQRVKNFFQKKRSSDGFGSWKAAGMVGAEKESVISCEQTDLLARDNADLGPFLLKLARQAAGENPLKALDYATRAAKSFEAAVNGKPSLDLVMSLHVLAALHCSLGQFEEAIPVLEHSLAMPDIGEGGQEHALAAFAGNMQLGDTLALQGRGEDALAAYQTGLEVQMQALGEKDPRVGETCRYLAEAHAQAMQFDKAAELCQRSLDIHSEHSAPASIEEATDRRLMALILSGKGEHESALEQLVLASMALLTNSKDAEVAAVDTSIGHTYVCLGRFDEAVFAFQKALTVFKASKGEYHVAVASVYVSLAELYLKTGKFRESRTYCESALRIYGKQGGNQLDDVASGLTEIAVVYEALNEHEQALVLLQKALNILETIPGQQSAVAGVEAQIGVLNHMHGKYAEAHASFSKAVSKLRASGEKNSLLGTVLNQMGLSCVHLSEIEVAAELFEESKDILEATFGPHHPETLAVCSNLAGAYDALGRLDDAIIILVYVVEVREEELGTANPEVEDERNRLEELLKEAGRLRDRRLNYTLQLLMQSNSKPTMKSLAGQNSTGHPLHNCRISEVKAANA